MQRNVLGGVGFGLEEPPLHGKERRSVGDVVHEEDAVRAAVEAGGEGAEALLAGLGGGLAGGCWRPRGRGGVYCVEEIYSVGLASDGHFSDLWGGLSDVFEAAS